MRYLHEITCCPPDIDSKRLGSPITTQSQIKVHCIRHRRTIIRLFSSLANIPTEAQWNGLWMRFDKGHARYVHLRKTYLGPIGIKLCSSHISKRLGTLR